MKVIPANLPTTKSLAKSLFENLVDFLDLDISLQQGYELYAKALGYNNWHELSKVVQKAHIPMYVDLLPENEQQDAQIVICTRLAAALGFDYLHGQVFNAAVASGLGYSPKKASSLREMVTPWGIYSEKNIVAPGIIWYETPSHGGYWLSPERQVQMEKIAGTTQEWFEEDCEAAKVEAVFKEFFDQKSAAARLRNTFPELMKRLFNLSPEEYDAEMHSNALKAFRSQPDTWFAVDQLGHINEIREYLAFGYFALKGSDATLWFETHNKEAVARGAYFINAPSNYESVVVGEPLPTSCQPAPVGIEKYIDSILSCGEPRHSLERFMRNRPRIV